MQLSNLNHNESHASSRSDCAGEIVNVGRALKQQILDSFEESTQAMQREHKNTENWMSILRQEVQKSTCEIRVACQRMEIDIGQCRGLLNDVIKTCCIQPEDVHGEVVNRSVPATVSKRGASTLVSGASPRVVTGASTLASGGRVVTISELIEESMHAPGERMAACSELSGESKRVSSSGQNRAPPEPNGESLLVPSVVEKPTRSVSVVPTSAEEPSCALTQPSAVFYPKSSEDDRYIPATSILTEFIQQIEFHDKKQAQVNMFLESQCQCYHSKCVPSMLGRLIHSIVFNSLCAWITLAYAIVVGIEADIQIRAALYGQSLPSWLKSAAYCFNVWFVAEVTVRMFTDGIHYFLDTENWRWNVFDLAIAVLSLVDMFAATGSFGLVRVLRALKIVKALRVVRLLGIFRDLRLLLAAVLTSLASLFWSVILLVVVIYLAAVTLVEAAATHVKDGENVDVDAIKNFYSSLSLAMYTLLMCITGGMDWSDAASVVWHLGWFYGGTFVFYILFCLLGVLNVITSIFLERAANMKKHDRDYAVSEELRTMEEEIESTLRLFETLLENGVREIEMAHLEKILKDKRVIAHFASIGIEISDRAFIAHTLGDNVGGLVDTKAFVRGCLALRGGSRQSDTHYIVLHVNKLEATVKDLMNHTTNNFRLLFEEVAELAHSGRNAEDAKSHMKPKAFLEL